MPATQRIERLAKHHDRSGFRCGSEALDRYLQQQARQDADKHAANPRRRYLPMTLVAALLG